jgi:hypothetical protein
MRRGKLHDPRGQSTIRQHILYARPGKRENGAFGSVKTGSSELHLSAKPLQRPYVMSNRHSALLGHLNMLSVNEKRKP